MRIIILGSTGMAGNVVSKYLEEKGYSIFRCSRSEENGPQSAAIDVTDIKALSDWMNGVEPDVIINCIGLLQKSCEQRPDLAVLVNSYLPHYLEQKYVGCKTKIIHLSTDCVFSGEKGSYIETDLQDGHTMYDRSKALGEIINDKDLTFRMSIIGPDIDPKGTGLFNWFMQQKGELSGWSKAIWNGVTTIELARAIDCALLSGLNGLYHLVQSNPIDKCSLLKLFKEVFDKKDITIRAVDGLRIDKTLINTRTDFDFSVKSYREQIMDMKTWIYAHEEMYPHYDQ